eukprot:TRINITY_DN2880_c1_g1::TRINITY_DN2880_c1_g1_i5::g.6009::m.6009 TRINITY_DN2880_c1_g1::TRINITY_DN2880_c1_g1_i5::g.6009  ORF type:complete len:310 (-),score=43.78,sp/Q9JLJ4/ELOV2_MOUSE/34.84/3e-31,ELO/PF01151.13/1.4e-51,UPF0121/PF03661.8/1.1e+03,UPF0121/PF03661.8/2.1e+03,UPF0121/PF03661.8/0.0042 TRINITY_DN2880_c1_g1_i5:1990-2838(-)
MDYVVGAYNYVHKYMIDGIEEGARNVQIREQQGVQHHWPYAEMDVIMKMNTMYLAVCLVLYLFMRNRAEGFRLKGVIACYNVVCVILAAITLYGTVKYKFIRGGGFMCNTTDPVNHPEDMWYAWYYWMFYLQKYFEYCDTWFFILRKSFRQVTFLHIYHHCSITLIVGSHVYYDWAGDIYLPVMLNSFIHVLMYTHYLLTSVGIQSWWRQYLTSLQLIQFVLIGSQNFLSFMKPKDQCPGLSSVRLGLSIYMVTMIILFADFYRKAYGGKPRVKAVEDKKKQ